MTMQHFVAGSATPTNQTQLWYNFTREEFAREIVLFSVGVVVQPVFPLFLNATRILNGELV